VCSAKPNGLGLGMKRGSKKINLLEGLKVSKKERERESKSRLRVRLSRCFVALISGHLFGLIKSRRLI